MQRLLTLLNILYCFIPFFNREGRRFIGPFSPPWLKVSGTAVSKVGKGSRAGYGGSKITLGLFWKP